MMMNISTVSISNEDYNIFERSKHVWYLKNIQAVDDIAIRNITRYDFSQSLSIQPENEILAYYSKFRRFRYISSCRPLCDIILFDIYHITKELEEAREEGCDPYYDGYRQVVIWGD